MASALPKDVLRVLEAGTVDDGADDHDPGAEFLLFLSFTDRLLEVDLPGSDSETFEGPSILERRQVRPPGRSD